MTPKQVWEQKRNELLAARGNLGRQLELVEKQLEALEITLPLAEGLSKEEKKDA